LTRMLILKAEGGGGFTSMDTYNPETGEDVVSVVYIEPLNDHAFILVSQKVGSYLSQNELHLRGRA
ncbi:MAG: hypothetical protein Q4Q04_04820, partial [Methanocorpusculum sp.]|nr:hypothetical protein [Methanocorpusculum sp.]